MCTMRTTLDMPDPMYLRIKTRTALGGAELIR